MIRLGTLAEVTQVNYDVNFINGFLEEDYDYCIARIQNQIFLEEESEAEKQDDKANGLIAWIKKNCINKPRDWFAKMILKLNNFASYIRVKEETRPGERNIWSKIRSKIAQFIVWLTNAMHKVVRRKDSDVLSTNDDEDLNKTIDSFKNKVDNSNDKLRQWKANNIILKNAIPITTKLDRNKFERETNKRYKNKEFWRTARKTVKPKVDGILRKYLEERDLDYNDFSDEELEKMRYKFYQQILKTLNPNKWG